MNPIPWYKNHILLLIILIPLATVCGSMYTIYLAVSSKEAPILEDYSKTGLSPQKRDMGHTAITATLDIDGGTITLEREPHSPTAPSPCNANRQASKRSPSPYNTPAKRRWTSATPCTPTALTTTRCPPPYNKP